MTDNSHQRIAESYAITFKTPTGVAVLNHLKNLYYDNDAFDKDPYVHARNAGRRDVVRLITQLRDQIEKEHAREKETSGEHE